MKYFLLHERAQRIVKNYNQCVTELLSVLQDLDRLKAYKDYNCSSLYDYCIKILKLSEDVSLNFIRIARVSVKVPELKEKISSGELKVSNARKVAGVITPDNAKHWIELAIKLPQQKLELEVAKVSPKQAVMDKVRVLSENSIEFRTTLSANTLQKLKRVMDLESQRKAKSVTYEEALNEVLKHYLNTHDPVIKAQRIEKRKTQKQEKEIRTTELQKTKQNVATIIGGPDAERAKIELITTTNSKQTTQDTAKQVVLIPVVEKKNTRIPIPASIKHAVALRDYGRCTYIDKSSQRCNERRWLHMHHVLPVSEGGNNDVSNLMTLCSYHHAIVHQLSLF